MGERRTPARVVYIDYTCNMCDAGLMEPSGTMLLIDPPLYPHTCGACGEKKNLSLRYPTYEVIAEFGS